MIKKIYSKHYSPTKLRRTIEDLMNKKLLMPIFAGLVFAAVVAGFTLVTINKKEGVKEGTKSLVFQRQLIGKNKYVADVKGAIKVGLGTEKDGGRVTVSRGKSNLEFIIPIDNPTLNSQDIGILQATDVSFASKDKIISARYSLVPNGIKEEIIMNKIPQQSTLPIKMKVENLKIKLNPDGLPVFYDTSGVYLFHFERPFAIDGGGNVSYGVRYKFLDGKNKNVDLFTNIYGKDTARKLSGNNTPLPDGQYMLVIEIDKDWLHDPKRVLPVTIDPTVVHNTASEFNAGDYNRSYPDSTQNTGAPTTELTGDANTIGLYHFNETANNTCSGGQDACDSSGNSNHGTETNTTISNSVSQLGAARTYNGGSSDVALANEANFDFERTNTFSIEAWIKTSSTSEQKIFSKLDSSAPNSGYEFWIQGNTGKLSFYLVNSWSGNAIQVVGTKSVTDNEWHHVAMTYAGTSLASGVKLYVDGVEETTVAPYNALSASILNNIAPHIGSRNHNSFYYSGAIDELIVTNDVRTSVEIASDAARGPAISSYYQELPADKNTIGLWHLNEASGNALDSSGNGNTGTPTGTTVVASKDGFSNARSFNGTTNTITVTSGSGTSLDMDVNPITIEAWIKPNNVSAEQHIVSRGTRGTEGYGLLINYPTAGYAGVGVHGGSNFGGTTQLVAGQWYHIAGVINGDSSALYVNGNLEATGTVNTVASNLNLHIGSSWDGAALAYLFDGVIDEVRVSNVARTPEEIKLDSQRRPYSIYSSDVIDLSRVASWNSLTWTELGVTTGDGETLKNTSGLVAQWNFNETSGTAAANNAGSCSTTCDGTLANFASTGSQDAAANTGWTAENKRWGAGALMFDGTDDVVTSGGGTSMPNGSQPRSIAAWIFPRSTTSRGMIVSYGNNTDNNKWDFEINGWATALNGKLIVHIWNAGIATTTNPIKIDRWNYVVVTYDGGNSLQNGVKLYVNGVQQPTQDAGNGTVNTWTQIPNTSNTNLQIGKRVTDNAGPFPGAIDSVSVFSRSLSISEIISNYNSSQLEFQTRVGESTNPDDGTWEEWRPTSSETQIDDFDSNTDSDGIDTVYLGDVSTNQTWIKKNNVIPSASDTTSTDGRVPVGTAGKGDVTYAFTPYVIKDGSTYKMWYGGHDGTTSRVYYATSSDGLAWTKYNNTIEAPSDTTGTNGRLPLGSTVGRGDVSNIQYPAVIKDGSTYKMWYAGNDGTNWRIYYATSSDGLTWTKYDNTVPTASDTSSTNGRIPLGTSGKGDESGALAPSVIKDGSTYKMWYSGLQNGGAWRIYYATSSDGLAWTKYNNTIPTVSDNVSTDGRIPLGNAGTADASHAYIPRVIKDGNVYKMWYGMHNGNVREGYAISNDGLTWSKFNNGVPGVSDTTGTFGRVPLGNTGRGDQTHAFGGSVIKDNGAYKMWYQGYDGTASYRIYYASMTPLPLKQELDSNIKMEGTASEKITTGISKIDAGTSALWHLDETGGTGAYIKDSSGNASHGTPTGTTVADGISGKARNFNGSSDYITVTAGSGAPLDIDANPVTIEAWVRPDSFATNNKTIVGRGDSGTEGYGLLLTTGGLVNLGSHGGSNFSGVTVLTTGQWYHVVGIINGASSAIYINGRLDATGTVDVVASNLNLYIGATFDVSTQINFFDGIIDEVRISKVARTNEEIYEAYRNGRSHYVNKTISSTDLSGKSSLPFYVAADRPGTYLQASIGESGYVNYQPDANTKGFWRLEDVDTSTLGIKDASTYGNSMTSGSTTVVQGKIGKARYFSGANYATVTVNTGNSLDIDANPVTLEAWIRPTTISGTAQAIITRGQTGTNGWGFRINTTGKINLGSHGGSNYDGATTIEAGKWYHVVGVINGASSALYVNGKLDGTGTVDVVSTTNTVFYLGADYDGATQTYFYTGIIDEARVSNVVRTAAEIRQAYEVGTRSHPVTIDFAANLDSGNLIANSGDTSFTVDATAYGLINKGSKLYPGDKIIVRENYDGTEYIAQGTVSSVNESTGATTVVSWDSGGTFPSGGYTANASVFKWQREYWNITEPQDSHVNATTNLTLQLLDGNEGRTIWIDDLASGGDYLTTPTGSTITSSADQRYLQYRVIQHSSDETVSASLTSVTVDYVQNAAPNTPSLDTPTDSATNRSLTPVIQTTTTDTNSDNLKYKIELCTDLAMTLNCQTFDQTISQTGWSGQNADGNTTYTSGTQATYTVQTPLLASTTYYWRTYAIDPLGVNQWSSTQGTPYSFTTSNPPTAPGTPYAEGATNPTGVTDITPEFSAIHNDPEGDSANFYQIQVNTQSDFLGTSMWNSGKTSMTTTANAIRSPDISYAGTAIPLDGAGTTYYWRIKFWDVNGAEGAYTTAQSFTMNITPNTPSLDDPTNGATNQSVAPSLKTTATDNNSDNLKYKIELCTDSGMSQNCQTFDQTISQTGWSGQNADTNTTYTSGTQATYNVQSSLLPGFVYYWRSYTIDPSGSNTWSGTQGSPNSFTTTTTDYPTQCRIEKANDNKSLVIKWNDNSPNEINYEVQKSTDGGGFSLLQTLSANSTSHLDNAISNGHSYQYRVAAIFNGSQYSQWCNSSTLTLGQGTLNFRGVDLK